MKRGQEMDRRRTRSMDADAHESTALEHHEKLLYDFAPLEEVDENRSTSSDSDD